MRLIKNHEPYIFTHKCTPEKKGQRMNDEEKREFLTENLIETYRMCNMDVSFCAKPKLSFFDKLRGKKIPTIYPNIVIKNFHGKKGKEAYYIVLPKGTSYDEAEINHLPDQMQNTYVKIILGSVFNMNKMIPDMYIHGDQYAFRYESKAVFPKQENYVIHEDNNSKRLAEIFLNAWKQYDTRNLAKVLDKDCHYDNDSVFDDMASRDEFIDYLNGKFDLLRNNNSILRAELGRNGETGEWSVIVKQRQTDGTTIVCAYMLECNNKRITCIKIRQMDLPDF